MPKDGVAGNGDNLHARKADSAARDAQLRKKLDAGTLGLAQLFPGGMKVDAQRLAPLPQTFAVAPVRSLGVPAPRATAVETPPMLLASSAAGGGPGACVYKPVMSDADIEACR